MTHTALTDADCRDGVSGRGSTTATTQGAIPILPAPVIASDNTLGSFSQHRGPDLRRLHRQLLQPQYQRCHSQAGNTDIFLLFSDDGGKTWSPALQVNDDNAATDGYSGSVAGGPLGRTQYQPQIAVDQSTGTLVLSFLDARNDPSDARVATYVAASLDGGATFTADVYANPTATRARRRHRQRGQPRADPRQPVVHRRLAGHLGLRHPPGPGRRQRSDHPVLGVEPELRPLPPRPGGAPTPEHRRLDPLAAAGPRIIASTQGPVGLAGDVQNTTRAADGTTLANTIDVTFDRPIDPNSFTIGNVTVFYEDPQGDAQQSLPIVSVTPVASTALGAYQFAIVFNPAGLTSFAGTYSYVIRPTGISDRIRHVITGGSIATGNVMDQNADGVPGQPHDDDYLVGKPTTLPVTYTSTSAPSAIPAFGTLRAPIVITDNYLVQNDNGTKAGVILALDITYPTDSDLTAFLLAPDGVTTVPLFTRIGGTGANFTGTTFNDLAASSIDTGTAPFTGSFKPETLFTTLNAAQISSLGTWTLVIRNAGTSTGTLNSWSLTFQPPQSTFTSGTLPLIVPGPHLTSTAAIDSTGNVISSGTNNLVLNNTVSSLQLTWDRNISVSSFTPAQILSIMGPAGVVSLAGVTITPLFGLHARRADGLRGRGLGGHLQGHLRDPAGQRHLHGDARDGHPGGGRHDGGRRQRQRRPRRPQGRRDQWRHRAGVVRLDGGPRDDPAGDRQLQWDDHGQRPDDADRRARHLPDPGRQRRHLGHHPVAQHRLSQRPRPRRVPALSHGHQGQPVQQHRGRHQHRQLHQHHLQRHGQYLDR